MKCSICEITKKLVKACIFCIPRLYLDVHGASKIWIILRYIVNYVTGVCIAFIVWKFLVVPLNFNEDYSSGILILLIILLGLGFAFTAFVKCLVILICVGMVSISGRGFLRALCVACIVSGPLANLASNGQEVVRVFACTTVLTYNLTKTRFDLMTKPFQNTLAAMRGEISEIRNNFESLENVIEPIKEEIEGDFFRNLTGSTAAMNRLLRENPLLEISKKASSKKEKADEYRAKYRRKMHLRCKEQLEFAEKRCEDAFNQAHEECMEKLPAVVDLLLCWPMKIDVICDMRVIGYKENGGICDPGDHIDPNLGEDFVELKGTEYDLFHNATNVSVSYKLVEIGQPHELMAAKDTASKVMDEIKEKKRTIDYVLAFIQDVLSFAFIKVIHSSLVYHRNYMAKIDFDNIYLTSYFKKIDERRKSANHHHLLPLKKFEKQLFIDTDNSRKRTKEESKARTFLILQFSLELLISCFFLFLDHAVVVLLRIVASNSEITYYQEGEHIINFHINGTGLMARLLRKTLQNFNMHERISTYLTNKPCLPNPSVLSKGFYVKLLAMYLDVFVLIYSSASMLRCRRSICAYFYRKREKERVLHLYNRMLRQRKSFFETMYQAVKECAENQKMKANLNPFLWLRLNSSLCFQWLRFFKLARRRCLICRDLEPRSDNDGSSPNFVECDTPKCYFIYCEECWHDMGKVCLACKVTEDSSIKMCSS